jgi:OFA family oxalate/formate antiporter-like MFS transporter
MSPDEETEPKTARAGVYLLGILLFLWAWLSGALGRKNVFLMMFALRSIVFLMLSRVSGFTPLAILACVILLCYGGGFGTMPALATDYFGAKDLGRSTVSC